MISYICEVYEITVFIHKTKSANGIAPFLLVVELKNHASYSHAKCLTTVLNSQKLPYCAHV